MISSARRRKIKTMSDIRFLAKPELRTPAMVVGWTMDAGRLGSRVTDYLASKLGGQAFCEIEPVDFFPLSGVTIASDIVYFPESKFYACPEKNLVIFRSTPPSYEWYRFLNMILDVAQDYCHVREIYNIGSMVALGAHTVPRQFFGTVNSVELKAELSDYSMTREIDYETPPGGKPTLNSYFLWNEKRRHIPGVNLWVPVPFYLVSAEDPAAYRSVLGFLDNRLDLGLDLTDLDEQARLQNEKIDQVRASQPEVDRIISKLERGLRLEEGEGEKLAREVSDFLMKSGN
jgi:proteasome assembly chaperone (PAC2) family protein